MFIVARGARGGYVISQDRSPRRRDGLTLRSVDAWVVWVIVAVGLAIAEVMTLTLVLANDRVRRHRGGHRRRRRASRGRSGTSSSALPMPSCSASSCQWRGAIVTLPHPCAPARPAWSAYAGCRSRRSTPRTAAGCASRARRGAHGRTPTESHPRGRVGRGHVNRRRYSSRPPDGNAIGRQLDLAAVQRLEEVPS